MDASAHELKTQSTQRYDAFCQSFYRYVHDSIGHDDANVAALAPDQNAGDAGHIQNLHLRLRSRVPLCWIWAPRVPIRCAHRWWRFWEMRAATAVRPGGATDFAVFDVP